MIIQRILPETLPAFQTIHPKEKPKFLDVLSGDGNLELLNQLPEIGLAIVGTRYPQKRSVDLLEQTLNQLQRKNLAIISGFARGIDSRAHEFALEYGLKTIAILGSGIDIDYPKENRHLKESILDSGGLLISEWERDTQPYPGNFLRRNRLIAAFSKAVWVVEAAASSGSLNTANWATAFNRELFATSCFPNDIYFQGNQLLLSQTEPEKFGIALPFFGPESFSPLWSHIRTQNKKHINPSTQIEKWIAEIKGYHGVCYAQTLMNHAKTKGMTPGQFYLEFEKALTSQRIIQIQNGEVDLSQTSFPV